MEKTKIILDYAMTLVDEYPNIHLFNSVCSTEEKNKFIKMSKAKKQNFLHKLVRDNKKELSEFNTVKMTKYARYFLNLMSKNKYFDMSILSGEVAELMDQKVFRYIKKLYLSSFEDYLTEKAKYNSFLTGSLFKEYNYSKYIYIADWLDHKKNLKKFSKFFSLHKYFAGKKTYSIAVCNSDFEAYNLAEQHKKYKNLFFVTNKFTHEDNILTNILVKIHKTNVKLKLLSFSLTLF